MADSVKDASELLNESAAAIVLREPLMAVEGEDGVIFPPTFAAAEDKRVFAGGYNIDTFANGKNVCLIDSVGSQANRIEPMFAVAPYAELIPQIIIEAGERRVNLLEAGHRAGDAIVRCSELQSELQACFRALLKGDAEPLALVSPTSLVFGVWDSRDTQAKAPRLLAASVRAFDVDTLTRSAQYNPALAYVEEGLLDETEDKTVLKQYSERGFQHVPATASHGGVIARGGVRREATLHLAALRTLRAGSSERTIALRNYLLGLALTAFTRPALGFLRQGCNLVAHETQKADAKVVFNDGKRMPLEVTHESALAFAKAAASKFGVGKNRTVKFDKERAKKDLEGGSEKKGKAKKAKAGPK